jgi:DNA-binding transcriptional ArsR family regulator
LSAEEEDEAKVLRGTTLRVYRFIFKAGKPVGISELQEGLGFSSSSVASYHVSKLLEAGLIREQDKGYVMDKVVFDNMVRVRRTLIPFQTAYMAFFAVAFLILLTYLRPPQITSTYGFALVVCLVGVATSLYEVVRALKKV